MATLFASVSMALSNAVGALEARSSIKFMNQDKLERKLRRKKRQAALAVKEQEQQSSGGHGKNPRHFGEGPLRANCTPPIEISFVVPDVLKPGTQQVCVVGPHGALKVDLPAEAKPGQEVKVRLGPSESYKVAVPEGVSEGELMTLKLPSDLLYQVKVPMGLQVGDTFEIIPPVLMVQVPEKAAPGTKVVYTDQKGEDQVAVVPEGKLPGQYFEVPL